MTENPSNVRRSPVLPPTNPENPREKVGRERSNPAGGTVTAKIPFEVREFLRNNKQVICSDQRIRFMTLKAIRKAVIAGKADDWDVIDFDFDTGEATFVCVYCVTGVEHPDDGASSVMPEPASATRH